VWMNTPQGRVHR